MGKKASAARVSVDDLVKNALQTVAEATGPLRLSGKAGDPPALFASASGASKNAIEQLTAQEKPLISITGPKARPTITLTPAGFARIAGSLPEEKVGAAAKAVAGSLPPDEQVAFLQEFLPKFPTAAAELEPLLAEAVRRQEAVAAERVALEQKRAERLEVARDAIRRCMDHLARLKAARVEELKSLLLAAGGSIPEQSAGQAGIRPPSPVTDEDRDFRRDVARRLVSSWRDAVNMKKDEARSFLETALETISGLRRVGEEGEQVAFDGALHENIPGVFTSHPVRIVRPGWALEEGADREYVIQKAVVAK